MYQIEFRNYINTTILQEEEPLPNISFDIPRLEKHFFLFPRPLNEYNFKSSSENKSCITLLYIFVRFFHQVQLVYLSKTKTYFKDDYNNKQLYAKYSSMICDIFYLTPIAPRYHSECLYPQLGKDNIGWCSL